jgi:hypothetical protein
MREVATTSAFLALQELAGSGGGSIQRDALVQELAARYLPVVVDEVRQLVNGMLDQPDDQTTFGSTSAMRPASRWGPENLVSTSNQFDEHISVETGGIGVGRPEDVAYQYIKHKRIVSRRAQVDPACSYIPDSPSQSVNQKGSSLGSVLVLASIPVFLIAGLAFLASIDARTSTGTRTDEPSVNDNKLRPEKASSQPARSTTDNNEGPRYGHPVYDPTDGYNWTFYRHLNGVDWYLDPKSKKYDVPGGFQILMRSVEPDNINFGPLYINCESKRYSAYYEDWKDIFPAKEENLVTSLYAANCNLPASKT